MHEMMKEAHVDTTVRFPESLWNEIGGRVARAFRMTAEEEAWLLEGRISHLIAALPFLAGCEDPERTAVAHLGTYLLSVRETKPYFNATAADDASVMERLRLGTQFKGGDQRILERGLALLALNMVSDYYRDQDEDARLGKYNPISAGAWDYKKLVADLQYRIISIDCEEMEKICSLVVTPMAYWGGIE